MAAEEPAGYRDRPRGALAESQPRSAWLAALAVVVVTLLTATAVAALVMSRHTRAPGLVASGARTTPTPALTPSPRSQASGVQLSAPSASTVWALVDYAGLYRSVDRGDHWEGRAMPADFGVRPAISFVSESEGWLLAPGSPATQCQAAPALVMHTTDAGATWEQLPASGLGTAQCKELIYFADARHGFISAWDANHQPTVYQSADGGLTWHPSKLPDPPNFVTKTGGFMLRVAWIKSTGGTVFLEAEGTQDDATWPHRHYMFMSVDGGTTWMWKQKVASQDTVIVTESRWLQLAPDVEETVNGGQQFHPFESDFTADTTAGAMNAVFTGTDVGYVAAGDAVKRTVDGGAHWARIRTPGGAVVIPSPNPSPSPVVLPTSVNLSAPTPEVVWALVAGSRLFVSTDRGQTWQERALPRTPAAGAASEVSFVDSLHGWLATCSSTTTLLWRTADGAHSWQGIASPFPPDQCLTGLLFVDRSHGFLGARYQGSGPTIFRTVDGGDSWSATRFPGPPGFKVGSGHSFRMVTLKGFGSVELALATSDAGALYAYRSTDAGATWTYFVTIPGLGKSVAFVTATRWIQVIAPGQSRESSDAGMSWHAYASDYSQAAPIPPVVVFAGPSVGYATVRGGIKRTLDGGRHWSEISTPGTWQPG